MAAGCAQGTYRKSGSPGLILALFGLAIMALFVVVAMSSPGWEHAVTRHGLTEAVTVRDCLKKNGAMQLWINPSTGHHSEICQITDEDVKGNFGARISANDLKDDVTFFVFRKMHTLKQVVQYMINSGYVCASGCGF